MALAQFRAFRNLRENFANSTSGATLNLLPPYFSSVLDSIGQAFRAPASVVQLDQVALA